MTPIVLLSADLPVLCCAGYTRLLYRMSMDFLGWARYVPGIQRVWKGVAGQVGSSVQGHVNCPKALSRVVLVAVHACWHVL